MGGVDTSAIIVAGASTVVSIVVSIASWVATTAMNRLIETLKEQGKDLVSVKTTVAVHSTRLDGHDKELKELKAIVA